MGDLEQANKSPSQALFTLFNALSNKEKESFVTKFAHDVFHVKVLIRPDGTVLIPNEETAEVLNEPLSQKIKCDSLDELFLKLDEED